MPGHFAEAAPASGLATGARTRGLAARGLRHRQRARGDDLHFIETARLNSLDPYALEHAQRSAELSEAVDNLVSNQLSTVAGVLRLSAPPSISNTLLAPLLDAFQASYPNVRVHVMVTDRLVDHIAEGIDLVFRFGALRDSSLVARKILTYRHQLVASPAYLERVKAPRSPRDLLDHKLLAFSRWRPDNSWTFWHQNGKQDADHVS